MTKILVIDDESSIRDNVIEILKDEKFNAIGAENGTDGIKMAREHQPNLIICDVSMPDIDGYDVLTDLRQDPITVNIPFIFLTAKNDREDYRLGMELGADDYLTKPCTSVEIIAAVNARLKKHQDSMQQYVMERDKVKGLQQRIKELERLSNNHEDLLGRLSQELRDPLSSITMAIQMLKVAPSEQARNHYLTILQQECSREISLINQLSNLKEFSSSENTQFLQQFNIFNKPKS